MPVPRTASLIQVPFPDSSMPGMRVQESGGRIINAYVEPLGPAAPSQIIYRRAPGLRNFGVTTNLAPTQIITGFRGAIEVDGTLYCAFANNLVTFTSTGGTATALGTPGGFAGTAKGFFARNNKSPADKVFVDPDTTSIAFTAAGAFTSPIYVASANQPAPNSVCCIDGFFVFTASNGSIIASDLNSLTINPLSFAKAENKPDGLTRGVPWAGNLFLFGPATTEVWSNAGTTPFPFAKSLVIPRGIAGPYCVAGFEDNFSRALVWVADDNTVVRLNGYTPDKISPPDLDGLIEDVTDKRQLEMSVFMSRGHAFVLLSSPTWSWVFDLNNNKWAERQSYLRTRSRITGGLYAFNKWLCGDIASGNVQTITDLAHTEVNPDVSKAPQPFRWRLESGAVENFPVGARVGRFDCEFVTGVGITSVERPAQAIINVVANTTPSFGPLDAPVVFVDFNVQTTALLRTGGVVRVAGVAGTPEVNGTWPITVLTSAAILLNGCHLVAGHVYTPGTGMLTDLTALDPIETNPVVEISWSDDGGQTYYAPIIRRLGQQAQTKELVSLIACTGRSSWNARRWRLDISDPVHVGFMAAYQNISPKVSDIG